MAIDPQGLYILVLMVESIACRMTTCLEFLARWRSRSDVFVSENQTQQNGDPGCISLTHRVHDFCLYSAAGDRRWEKLQTSCVPELRSIDVKTIGGGAFFPVDSLRSCGTF